MEPTSSKKNEDLDYWEIVSGSKSLTTETVQSLLQSIEGESLALKEKEGKQEVDEDWYTTIPPATPANTPEYTPTPPSYPSAALRKDLANLESGELSPIKELKEEVVEDVKPEVTEKIENSSGSGEDSFYFEYSPVDSESEGQTSNKTLKLLESWLYRIAAYLIVFSLVRWAVSKVWGRLRSLRNANENK